MRHRREACEVDALFDAGIGKIAIAPAHLRDEVIDSDGREKRQVRCADEHEFVWWEVGKPGDEAFADARTRGTALVAARQFGARERLGWCDGHDARDLVART